MVTQKLIPDVFVQAYPLRGQSILDQGQCKSYMGQTKSSCSQARYSGMYILRYENESKYLTGVGDCDQAHHIGEGGVLEYG